MKEPMFERGTKRYAENFHAKDWYTTDHKMTHGIQVFKELVGSWTWESGA